MHVLHALFTRHLGGLEQAYINVTEALAHKGHEVTALVCDDAPYRREVAAHADAVVSVQPHGFYDVVSIWAIRRRLKLLRPDMIIAHNGRAISLLAHASRGMAIPLCGVSHSYKTARALPAGRLVVLSEHMRRHFLEAGYRRPMTIIPNLFHLSEPFAFRTPEAPVVIGAIGRFVEEKGFVDFFHALHELKRGGVDFTVRLAGDGPQRDRLKALEQEFGLAPHLRWEGWIADKPAFYRGLNMLCIPSHLDSFPLVLLEALAYSVPVVTTDALRPTGILTEGVNSMIVPCRDSLALARALRSLAEQPALARRLARAGWETAQRFGFDAVAAQWDDLVRSVTAATPSFQAA